MTSDTDRNPKGEAAKRLSAEHESRGRRHRPDSVPQSIPEGLDERIETLLRGPIPKLPEDGGFVFTYGQVERLLARALSEPSPSREPATGEGARTFLDEIEAWQKADPWIDELAQQLAQAGHDPFIDRFPRHGGGGICVLYDRTRPYAAAIVWRDDFNRSCLIYWRAASPPIEASPIRGEDVAGLREKLRVFMLKQPTTYHRDTYSDGFAQALAHAIQEIDGLTAMQGEGLQVEGLGGPDGQPATHEPSLASRLGPAGECQAQGGGEQ